MLKLTRKVEYALIALRYMQRNREGNCASAKEISNLYNIPLPLLSKILQNLSRANIIHSIRGPHGGYLLNVNPENTVVIEDSVHGINSGLSSGAFVVGYRGSVPESALEVAHLIINNHTELSIELLVEQIQNINISEIEYICKIQP